MGGLLLLVRRAAPQAGGVHIVGQAVAPHSRPEGHQAAPKPGSERWRPLLHGISIFVFAGVAAQARGEAPCLSLAACKQQQKLISRSASSGYGLSRNRLFDMLNSFIDHFHYYQVK
jgi:hypothetical protein